MRVEQRTTPAMIWHADSWRTDTGLPGSVLRQECVGSSEIRKTWNVALVRWQEKRTSGSLGRSIALRTTIADDDWDGTHLLSTFASAGAPCVFPSLVNPQYARIRSVDLLGFLFYMNDLHLRLTIFSLVIALTLSDGHHHTTTTY